MKKAVLVIVFCFWIGEGFTQDIIQQWNVAIFDDSFSPEHPHATWYTNIYKASGDTLIKGLSYKKLYISSDSLFVDSFYYTGLRYQGDKIYFINRFGDDYMLYDFNLDVGDTAFIRNEYHAVIVDSVTTIYFDGVLRKKLFVTYYCVYDDSIIHESYASTDIWIAGVGSIHNGILNEVCACATGCYLTPHLLCYQENDKLLLQDTSFNTCFKESSASSIVEKEDDNTRIYPTLLSSYTGVIIESDNVINKISIFDLQGILVYKKSISTNSYSLDLNYLNNGFYIIVVNDSTYKLLIVR